MNELHPARQSPSERPVHVNLASMAYHIAGLSEDPLTTWHFNTTAEGRAREAVQAMNIVCVDEHLTTPSRQLVVSQFLGRNAFEGDIGYSVRRANGRGPRVMWQADIGAQELDTVRCVNSRNGRPLPLSPEIISFIATATAMLEHRDARPINGVWTRNPFETPRSSLAAIIENSAQAYRFLLR